MSDSRETASYTWSHIATSTQEIISQQRNNFITKTDYVATPGSALKCNSVVNFQRKYNAINFCTPGQALGKHIPYCVDSPKQPFPCKDGLGFVHARNLFVIPCPQVLLHVVQWAQSVHPPWTESTNYHRELICLLSFTCNYVVSVWRCFLFLLVLWIGCVI